MTKPDFLAAPGQMVRWLRASGLGMFRFKGLGFKGVGFAFPEAAKPFNKGVCVDLWGLWFACLRSKPPLDLTGWLDTVFVVGFATY